MATAEVSDYPSEPAPFSERARRVRWLGERLIELQRPIRILDAVHWDESVERAFFAANCRDLPPVTRDYYCARPLRFDPAAKRREFLHLEADVRRLLGSDDPAAKLLARRCREYRRAVTLLDRRGTPDFYRLSRQLYGDATTAGLADSLAALCGTLAASLRPGAGEPDAVCEIDAAGAMSQLIDRLGRSLPQSCGVRIRLSDGIVADAAAGSAYIKLRRDARFSRRDLDLLEVHEGWVHLGTTLNGQAQPYCSFLARGTPSATRSQEGLAVLAEVVAGVCHPERIRRLWRRFEAVRMAEGGADFRDVYAYFLEAGDGPALSYQHAQRVFRGSLPAGCGPFTKDVSYLAGLAEMLSALRTASIDRRAVRIALIFAGKTALGDLPLLRQLADDGLLVAPQFLPPPFADARGLAPLLNQLPKVGTPNSRQKSWKRASRHL